MPHQNTEAYTQVTWSLLYKFLFDSGPPWNAKLYKHTKAILLWDTKLNSKLSKKFRNNKKV